MKHVQFNLWESCHACHIYCNLLSRFQHCFGVYIDNFGLVNALDFELVNSVALQYIPVSNVSFVSGEWHI